MSGYWIPEIQYGDLSSGGFRTAVDTRSLAIVRTVVEIPERGNFAQEERSLLYYEDPSGKVSALSQQNGGAGDNQTSRWVNVTSQASESLPDDFRNTTASTAQGYSKTLYESLGTDTTLKAPFTCGANWTGYFVGAIFYSPQLSSPNASDFQFAIEGYSMNSVSSSGSFTNELAGGFNNSTKPRIPHNSLQANFCCSQSSHLKPKTSSGLQLDYSVRYSSV